MNSYGNGKLKWVDEIDRKTLKEAKEALNDHKKSELKWVDEKDRKTKQALKGPNDYKTLWSECLIRLNKTGLNKIANKEEFGDINNNTVPFNEIVARLQNDFTTTKGQLNLKAALLHFECIDRCAIHDEDCDLLSESITEEIRRIDAFSSIGEKIVNKFIDNVKKSLDTLTSKEPISDEKRSKFNIVMTKLLEGYITNKEDGRFFGKRTIDNKVISQGDVHPSILMALARFAEQHLDKVPTDIKELKKIGAKLKGSLKNEGFLRNNTEAFKKDDNDINNMILLSNIENEFKKVEIVNRFVTKGKSNLITEAKNVKSSPQKRSANLRQKLGQSYG